VYGGCERSSSGSGSSKLSRNAGGRYGSGLGANNGASHTTWRNSGAGVSGAAVDIGDPGSEGDRDVVNGSSAGIGREMGSAGSAESAGGAWERSPCALAREEEWKRRVRDVDGLATVCSRRGYGRRREE